MTRLLGIAALAAAVALAAPVKKHDESKSLCKHVDEHALLCATAPASVSDATLEYGLQIELAKLDVSTPAADVFAPSVERRQPELRADVGKTPLERPELGLFSESVAMLSRAPSNRPIERLNRLGVSYVVGSCIQPATPPPNARAKSYASMLRV